MKAIGYLVAGAALLPGLVSALDPNYNITNWRYRGCYSYVLLTRFSVLCCYSDTAKQ